MRRFFHRSTALGGLFLAATFFGGCKKEPVKTEPPVKEVAMAGLVRNVDSSTGTLIIQHQDVPGFMPSMTMPFTAKDPQEISKVKIGDAISFRFSMTQDDSWIDSIKPVQAATLHLPRTATEAPTSSGPRLKEGDNLPEFSLVDQNNQPLSDKTFLGKKVLLTFIFTRCPVPNFCPLISNNFEKLEKEIKQNPALADRVRLLSISFDPEFDTPEILTEYSGALTSDNKFWRFATGPKAEIEKLTHAFSVYIKTENGTINHGLCTALINPDGKIIKLWRGNSWHPEEVMEEIKK